MESLIRVTDIGHGPDWRCRLGRATSRRLIGLVFSGLLIGSPAWPTTQREPDTQRMLAEALAELRAADVEWRQNDGEFRELRRKKEKDKKDFAVEEFAEFVASLYRKMLEACHRYRTLGGNPDSLGFKCPPLEEKEAPSQSEQDSPQPPVMAKTDMEKMSSTEDPFTQSLNEFDLWQQEKQEKVREVVASQKSTGSGGRRSSQSVRRQETSGGGIPSSPGATGNRSGGSSATERAGGGMGADGRMVEAGAGPGVEKQKGKTVQRRKGGGGGTDDDVVARQLREAAEKEQDPILKEKLWDEYRKYKASKR
ncbi:MAG: hypothetical protein GTO40_13155 [Deltaproteobacteria bacterium]|nr:hypothetical protein [Deltaproteobacteria bacterium]